MHITQEQKPILWALVAALVAFTGVFLYQGNTEFLFYIVVILFFFGLILKSNKVVKYPTYVLWGLFGWAVLHMLGGTEFEAGRVIYTAILVPLVGEPYAILKYDQVVHTIGFFIATLVMYYVLKPHLRNGFDWTGTLVVVAMAGLGLGALNEIIEFILTVVLPNTNVGGYENTALDLVTDLIGACIAVWYIYRREHATLKKSDV